MSAKAIRSLILFACAWPVMFTAGCASAPDPVATYDLNHDGVVSDAEYKQAMKMESLKTSTQARTSMRNSDVKGATDTALGAAAVGLGAANTVRAFVH